VPLNDLTDEDKNHYTALVSIPTNDILVIQNENDNHGTFAEVESFIHTINPQIQIVSRPRDDHDYPYPEDFKAFLAS
jgi:hypothetical protein